MLVSSPDSADQNNVKMKFVLSILATLLLPVVCTDLEREARIADTRQIDLEDLYATNEGFRNITEEGVPHKRVVGILSAASVGFKLLQGVASQVDLSRVCVVGFSNMGNRKLVNPEWFMHNGIIRQPLPREIPPGEGGVFTFEKTQYSTFGTSGVFTYTIENTVHQVVVMWDIPIVYGPFSNMFNVHILDGVATDRGLFDRMRQDEKTVEVWDSGHWLSRNVDGIQIHGAMTNNGKASFLVQVLYNITEPAAINRRF